MGNLATASGQALSIPFELWRHPNQLADELAHALNMDPIELRVRNEPTVDPERNVPYSERRVVECLREGFIQQPFHREYLHNGKLRVQ